MKNDELKLVKCRCGGEAFIHMIGNERIKGYYIRCDDCETQTIIMDTKAEAVNVWNVAMSAKDINVPNKFVTDTNVGNKIIYCKDCKYSHMTIDGLCKYCDIWFPNEEMYVDGKHFCASAEKRML